MPFGVLPPSSAAPAYSFDYGVFPFANVSMNVFCTKPQRSALEMKKKCDDYTGVYVNLPTTEVTAFVSDLLLRRRIGQEEEVADDGAIIDGIDPLTIPVVGGSDASGRCFSGAPFAFDGSIVDGPNYLTPCGKCYYIGMLTDFCAIVDVTDPLSSTMPAATTKMPPPSATSAPPATALPSAPSSPSTPASPVLPLSVSMSPTLIGCRSPFRDRAYSPIASAKPSSSSSIAEGEKDGVASDGPHVYTFRKPAQLLRDPYDPTGNGRPTDPTFRVRVYRSDDPLIVLGLATGGSYNLPEGRDATDGFPPEYIMQFPPTSTDQASSPPSLVTAPKEEGAFAALSAGSRQLLAGGLWLLVTAIAVLHHTLKAVTTVVSVEKTAAAKTKQFQARTRHRFGNRGSSHFGTICTNFTGKSTRTYAKLI